MDKPSSVLDIKEIKFTPPDYMPPDVVRVIETFPPLIRWAQAAVAEYVAGAKKGTYIAMTPTSIASFNGHVLTHLEEVWHNLIKDLNAEVKVIVPGEDPTKKPGRGVIISNETHLTFVVIKTEQGPLFLLRQNPRLGIPKKDAHCLWGGAKQDTDPRSLFAKDGALGRFSSVLLTGREAIVSDITPYATMEASGNEVVSISMLEQDLNQSELKALEERIDELNKKAESEGVPVRQRLVTFEEFNKYLSAPARDTILHTAFNTFRLQEIARLAGQELCAKNTDYMQQLMRSIAPLNKRSVMLTANPS